jgi:hypothetical protein
MAQDPVAMWKVTVAGPNFDGLSKGEIKGEYMSKMEERKSWWPSPESISARPIFVVGSFWGGGKSMWVNVPK